MEAEDKVNLNLLMFSQILMFGQILMFSHLNIHVVGRRTEGNYNLSEYQSKQVETVKVNHNLNVQENLGSEH